MTCETAKAHTVACAVIYAMKQGGGHQAIFDAVCGALHAAPCDDPMQDYLMRLVAQPASELAIHYVAALDGMIEGTDGESFFHHQRCALLIEMLGNLRFPEAWPTILKEAQWSWRIRVTAGAKLLDGAEARA